MIPNDLQERQKVIQYMLDSCIENDRELTEWEHDFISSISQQFQLKSNLTDRQCEILERIYDKI